MTRDDKLNFIIVCVVTAWLLLGYLVFKDDGCVPCPKAVIEHVAEPVKPVKPKKPTEKLTPDQEKLKDWSDHYME